MEPYAGAVPTWNPNTGTLKTFNDSIIAIDNNCTLSLGCLIFNVGAGFGNNRIVVAANHKGFIVDAGLYDNGFIGTAPPKGVADLVLVAIFAFVAFRANDDAILP